MAVATPTDRTKSVRNCCVIEVFGVVNWLLNLRVFVIGLAESDLVLFLFDAWYVSLRRVHISCPMLLSKKERKWASV